MTKVEIASEHGSFNRDKDQVMSPRSLEARSLIDEFLPNHDFSAAYEIRIKAPTSVVYERLLVSDFNEVRMARLLMTVRSGKRLPRTRVPSDLRRGRTFVVIDEHRSKVCV